MPPAPEPPDRLTGAALPPEFDPDRPGQHRLGPHVVGQRVVVRRVLPGVTGPTGGPAMTDVLGECVSWGRGLCEVRLEDGSVVAIHVADIVSGKPVPPRASVRMRVAPRDTHLRTLPLWPDAEQVELGAWVLRAAGLVPDAEHPQGRLVRRANSALAMGDPGVRLAEAAARVADFYTARDQPVIAQVLVPGGAGTDDGVEAGLRALGWEADEPDNRVMLAPVSRVLRRLGPGADADLHEEPEGQKNGARRAVVRIGPTDDEHGRVRVCVEGGWVTVHDVWVAPEHRTSGQARRMLAEALDWAASLGATTVHLQVREDNTAALALWTACGFDTHHRYRYLLPG